ncbi:MAG: ATP synthase F1 subunit epsilon [Candidatus Acidiferrales bacterium]
MLPEAIQLEVVTLERSVVRATVSEIQVPGRDGFLGILPGHTPLLTELGIGALSYKEGSETFFIAVIGGLAEVLPDRVIVLADAAERAEEIDVPRAQADADRARKLLASHGDAATNWDEILRELASAEARLAAAAGATAAAGAPVGVEA